MDRIQCMLASKFAIQNLYVVAELAQELIKIWAHSHSLNITTYPGKVKLPGDILRPLANSETSNKVSVISACEELPRLNKK